jgi:hypothetical protein
MDTNTWITGDPEVIGSSVGLASINKLVFTGLANFRVDNSESIPSQTAVICFQVKRG